MKHWQEQMKAFFEAEAEEMLRADLAAARLSPPADTGFDSSGSVTRDQLAAMTARVTGVRPCKACGGPLQIVDMSPVQSVKCAVCGAREPLDGDA